MKNKRLFKYKSFVFLVIFSLLFSFSPFFPIQKQAKAIGTLVDAKDTISDSDRGAIARHIITFKTASTTLSGGYFDARLDPNFGDTWVVGDITCSSGTPTKAAARTARCTLAADMSAGQLVTITINNVINPDPGEGNIQSYLIYLTAYSSGALQEQVDLRVAIIDDVVVTAKVSSNLTFRIGNIATSTAINGVTTTGFGATSSLAFGTLSTTASSTLGQQLFVTTNADDGYIVTVEQNHELLSNASSTINSFNNSQDFTGSTTPGAWAIPAGTLDSYNTYGHMGLTVDDSDLNSLGGYSDFTGNKFAGLNNVNPMTIMHHDGPSDGSTQNKGTAKVAYSIQITSLQEAGEYTNTLTYICTPTF